MDVLSGYDFGMKVKEGFKKEKIKKKKKKHKKKKDHGEKLAKHIPSKNEGGAYLSTQPIKAGTDFLKSGAGPSPSLEKKKKKDKHMSNDSFANSQAVREISQKVVSGDVCDNSPTVKKRQKKKKSKHKSILEDAAADSCQTIEAHVTEHNKELLADSVCGSSPTSGHHKKIKQKHKLLSEDVFDECQAVKRHKKHKTKHKRMSEGISNCSPTVKNSKGEESTHRSLTVDGVDNSQTVKEGKTGKRKHKHSSEDDLDCSPIAKKHKKSKGKRKDMSEDSSNCSPLVESTKKEKKKKQAPQEFVAEGIFNSNPYEDDLDCSPIVKKHKKSKQKRKDMSEDSFEYSPVLESNKKEKKKEQTTQVCVAEGVCNSSPAEKRKKKSKHRHTSMSEDVCDNNQSVKEKTIHQPVSEGKSNCSQEEEKNEPRFVCEDVLSDSPCSKEQNTTEDGLGNTSSKRKHKKKHNKNKQNSTHGEVLEPSLTMNTEEESQQKPMSDSEDVSDNSPSVKKCKKRKNKYKHLSPDALDKYTSTEEQRHGKKRKKSRQNLMADTLSSDDLIEKESTDEVEQEKDNNQKSKHRDKINDLSSVIRTNKKNKSKQKSVDAGCVEMCPIVEKHTEVTEDVLSPSKENMESNGAPLSSNMASNSCEPSPATPKQQYKRNLPSLNEETIKLLHESNNIGYTDNVNLTTELAAKGHKWSNGRWTKEEEAILRENWKEFWQAHSYEGEPHSLLNRKKADSYASTAEFIARTSFYTKLGKDIQRPLYNIYIKARKLFIPVRVTGKFSSEDKNVLADMVAAGMTTSAIARELGRSTDSILSRINKDNCKDTTLNRDFTSKEKEALLRAIDTLVGLEEASKRYERLPWSKIAEQVKTRNLNQCRDYWLRRMAWAIRNEQDIQHCDSKLTLCDNARLIEILVDLDVKDIAEVDWQDLMKLFPNAASPQHLKVKWQQIKHSVPGAKNRSLQEVLDYLVINKLPFWKDGSKSRDAQQ